MAKIYDYENGYEITDGLQGVNVCDEASEAAKSIARDRDCDVVLEDDDGVWLIDPNGTRSELAKDWAD